jgi:hypothetical protein
MKFRKYEFNSQSEWNTLKSSIQTVNGPMRVTSYINCDVVELGYLITSPDIVSNKYSVDILWHNNIPSTFTQYEVWPHDIGAHTFLGLEHLYREEYNNRNN